MQRGHRGEKVSPPSLVASDLFYHSDDARRAFRSRFLLRFALLLFRFTFSPRSLSRFTFIAFGSSLSSLRSCHVARCHRTSCCRFTRSHCCFSFISSCCSLRCSRSSCCSRTLTASFSLLMYLVACSLFSHCLDSCWCSHLVLSLFTLIACVLSRAVLDVHLCCAVVSHLVLTLGSCCSLITSVLMIFLAALDHSHCNCSRLSLYSCFTSS